MKIFFILPFFVFSSWATTPEETTISPEALLNSPVLHLSRTDVVIAEHLVNMVKLINKGYINKEILNKLLVEVASSKHYRPFLPWLREIKHISELKTTESLLVICQAYSERKETLPLEKRLENIAGNYCRERSLEAIGRDIERSNLLSDESSGFIQENLKFYLTKKNKKNFAYFVQSLGKKPEILKKVSEIVTTYSVRNEIVPSQEVLKDIEINEQITKLIQTKGFNPLQHQNVFYAEYGKLIELAYRSLDSKLDKKPEESKVKEHYHFLKNYIELNQDHLPLGLCLSRLNDFSKAVFRNDFQDLSRDIFKYIIKKNHKEHHEDALFFYLWTYISTGDFKGALSMADKHKLLKKDAEINDPRLKFWIGSTYEKLDKMDEAIAYYEDTLLKHPLSYYAIMSNKKLQALKPDSPLVNYYTSRANVIGSTPAINMKDMDEDHISSLVRLRSWAKIDSQKMLNLELKRLKLHSMPVYLVKQPSDKQLSIRSNLHLVNAKIIQDSRNHLAAFRYIYMVMDNQEIVFSRSLLEILYPRPYMDELVKVLKNDKLDPIVVLSLIRQESVFNPKAQSRVGARGLMQLMPTTARRLRKSVSNKHLVDPSINIELGTKYFKGLLKRYDGNLVYVLSAYNAGESRVERWKNQYWDSDETILKNIEQIPFLETRNYVKLIFRNIFFYKLLLEKSELADSGEPNKIFDVNLGFKR